MASIIITCAKNAMLKPWLCRPFNVIHVGTQTFSTCKCVCVPRGYNKLDPDSKAPEIDKWEKYASEGPPLKHQDRNYVTPFGHIRLDSQNKVTQHGQFDEEVENLKTEGKSVQEISSSQESTADNDNPFFEDDNFVRTEIFRTLSADKKPKKPKKSGQLSDTGLGNQPKVSKIKELSSVEINDSVLPAAPKFLNTEEKSQERRKKQLNKTSSVMQNESEDLNYFDNLLIPDSQLIERHGSVASAFSKEIGDSTKTDDQTVKSHDLDFINYQYFGSVPNMTSSQVYKTPLPVSDDRSGLMDEATKDMNFVDQQFFKKPADAESKIKVQKFSSEKKAQRDERPRKSSALSFVKSLRSFDSAPSGRVVTKESLVDQIDVSLQHRITKASRSEVSNFLKKTQEPDEEVEEEYVQSFGRVLDPKFLPPNLENMTSLEVLSLLKKKILYDKSDILAIDKPYGLQMFGESKTARHSMEKFLPDLAKHLDIEALYQVHRLDKQTTGVLLLAKTKEMHLKLTNLFRERKLKKGYWAIVNGTPDPTEGIINIPISETTINGRRRMSLQPEYRGSVVSNKKPYRGHVHHAVTEYRVAKMIKNRSLVIMEPVTGFKHQVRIHLGFGLGCPVLGDHKYSHFAEIGKPQRVHGDILERLNIRRSKSRNLPLYLHAKYVKIPEIIDDGREIWIEAPLPHFFVNALKKLKLTSKRQITSLT